MLVAVRFYIFIYFFLWSFWSIAQDSTQSIVVGKITLEGNKRTRPSIIFREIDIQEGDTIFKKNQNKILENIQNRLFNLNLFIAVEPKWIKKDSLVSDLHILFKERFYFFAAPIFELADRNFNEWWYDRNRDLTRTNYGMLLVLKNVRGRNESLEFNAQGGFIGRFKLSYKIPYLDKKQQYGLTLYFSYHQYKNLAFQTENNKLMFLRSENLLKERYNAEIRFRKRTGFYHFQHLDIRFMKNRIYDTIRALNPNYHLQNNPFQQFWMLGYEYIYDNRDFASYPLKGKRVFTRFEKHGIFKSDDLDLWILKAAYQYHKPLSSKFYSNFALGGRLLYHQGQPYSNASAMGYGNDLVRGFQLYVVDGQHYIMAKSTLKYQLVNIIKNVRFIPLKQFRTVPLAIYPKIYADTGYASDYVFAKERNPLANQMLWGTGIGVDFVSYYNSVFQIDVTYNKLNQFGLFFNFESSF
ncbi:MAG: BamA/TamA family outer membrane protein [Raineya sp.]|nr:BamA/TamA family outer membrane protein [Raineya sp.]